MNDKFPIPNSFQQVSPDSDAWLHGQKLAFEIAMQNGTLAASLSPLVNVITTQTGGKARTAFYTIPDGGTGLRLITGMSAEFANDVDGFPVGPASFACGLAMHTGSPVITPDVREEARWRDHLSLAEKHNIRASWSFPLRTDGGPVLGTLSVYYTEPRRPDAHELEMVNLLSYTAAVIISRHRELEERERAEKALQKSEERYRTLFKTIDEGFALMELVRDAHGNVTDLIYREVNQAFVEFTGWHNAVDKKGSELMPNLQRSVLEQMQHVADTGLPLRKEDHVTDLNRWYEVHYSCIGAPGSNFIVAVFNDTTERKRDEQRQQFLLDFSDALRAETTEDAIAERALRSLFEHLELDRCYISLCWKEDDRSDFPYQIGNDKLPPLPDSVRLSDLSDALRAPISGTLVINDLMNAAHLSDADKQTLSALGMKAMVAVSLRHGEKRPSWSIVSLSANPRNWTSQEIKLLAEATERTWAAIERTRAEKALLDAEFNYRIKLEADVEKRTIELQESRDSLQTIFDTTLVGISVFAPVRNAEGDITDFRIISVNKKVARSTGRDDMVGQLYGELFPGIRKMGLFDLMVKTIETGEPGKMDYHYTYDGIDRWYSTMFVKGEDVLVSTNIDITERVKVEEDRLKNFILLQQSEELANSGTWDHDLHNRVLTWSDGMYRLFDLENGTKVQPGIYMQYATPACREVAERVVKQIEAGDTEFEETLELLINGEVKVLRLKAKVVNDGYGKPIRVLGVDLDITAMRAAEQQIKRLEAEQQREVFRVSLSTLEEERHRISESLHNGLGQVLYGVKISLSGLGQQLPKPEFDEVKNYTNKLLTDAIQEARRISHQLMPTTLEEFGLKAAIEDICVQLSDSVQFKPKLSGSQKRLDKYLELAVYRTIQELMINVVKHAKATQALVELKIDTKRVLIRVSDDGLGMQIPKGIKAGIGLAAIRSKINLLNGTVNILSGKGTAVEVMIPLEGK